MLLLAVGGSFAAQSRTKDRVRKRDHRIFAAQTGRDQVTLAWDEVPGTTEYHIYLSGPDKPGPPAPGSRPTISFSGSGRRAIVMGLSRMAGGAYLEALGQGEVLYRGTFNAIANAPLAPPTAPAAVQARETGETEVTLSWDPVPGATAYMIGRAAGGSGLQMLCDICPPSGEFVDTTATPGLEHIYSVAAIFPLGISTRTPSNKLTVGAAQLAAATPSAPPAIWDKPMSSGTPVAGTDADNTNVGGSAGTPTTGTGTGTPTTGTTTGTTTTGTGTTMPPTGSTSNPCTPVFVPKTGTGIIYTKPMASGTPVAGTDADNTNVGASAGGCTTGTGTSTPTTGTGTSTPTGGNPGGFPAGTGASTPTGSTPGGMPGGSGASGSTPVHGATPVTGTGTTPAASCRLDYQRADNMWAAAGRPDGPLGVETISLGNGLAKVFSTDWAYEKKVNDGINYYGSHLRVATNPGNGVVQLRLKNPATAMFGAPLAKIGALVAERLGAPGWLIMKPGDRAEFRDDLMEVHCGQ